YESTKGNNPVMYNPYSTGITLQLIPKAAVDKIPILSMGYGLSAAAKGEAFPWIFNMPTTYWGQASAVIKYVGAEVGGMDKLKGKTIGFIYLDVGYGREPIPVFEQLATKFGYNLKKYPVPGKEMQNQSSQWLNVRRDRPDYMIMWGWGAMNPTAVKEAAKIRYPMDKFIGVWWSGGNVDLNPAGEDGKGYKSVNFHGTGTEFGAIQDIIKYVVDKGLSQADKANVGDNYYNRGVMNAVLVAEAIRTAQEKTGVKAITGVEMRVGLENLNLTTERLAEIGLEGFTNPIKVTCEDHAGAHPIYIQQWDGKGWSKVSDWFTPMTERVRPKLVAAADEWVKDKPDWQTQTCQ
ncbi:MAG: ABC transporter substrate-binding protein, partial [Gammaproteobacteria bacterium]|nr:ABC transporter substrate-binding protein [Gammaproteobacteria bacterium]